MLKVNKLPPPPSPPVLPMISRYTELRSFTAQQGFASSLEWDELSADEGLKEAQSVMAKAYHDKAEAAEVRRLADAVEHSRAVNVRLEGLQSPKGIGAGAWVLDAGFAKSAAWSARSLWWLCAGGVASSRSRSEGLQTPKGIGAGAWLLDAGFRSLVSSEFVVALRRRGFVTFPEL